MQKRDYIEQLEILRHDLFKPGTQIINPATTHVTLLRLIELIIKEREEQP